MKSRTQFWRPHFIWLTALMAAYVGILSGCTSEPAITNSSALSTPKSTDEAPFPDSFSDRILTRLFWQDRTNGAVFTGDLSLAENEYTVSKLKVNNFPEISPAENDLVQMQIADGRLIVAVRDHADGKKKSGWIEIDTGVEEEDHGDHSHWLYSYDATVSSSTLDDKQGNPAHVYRYGKSIYIANDKNNGFTQLTPTSNRSSSDAKFFSGGGGHITLAAVANRIAYSTWIDRSGDNCGRVDVVDLRSKSSEPRYSFTLPAGGIHGAGACGNRVYFAPASGVCWVNCDFDFTKNSDTVSINHLSLDEDQNGTDYRTGAFESFEDHMLCIANSKSGTPALCVINATAPAPVVTRIVCDDLQEGLKLSTVKATKIVGNKCFAFAFAEGEELDEKLLVFELDPNEDRKFDDAKLVNTIEVGASKLEGHYGHHSITFLGDQKTAVVTNPGDGTLSIVDLVKQDVSQTVDVGGRPTHLVCYGEGM
jgi:hypothetical protein